jgi:hypothetical protein
MDSGDGQNFSNCSDTLTQVTKHWYLVNSVSVCYLFSPSQSSLRRVSLVFLQPRSPSGWPSSPRALRGADGASPHAGDDPLNVLLKILCLSKARISLAKCDVSAAQYNIANIIQPHTSSLSGGTSADEEGSSQEFHSS